MKILMRRLCFGLLLAVLLLGGRFGQAQAIYGSLFGTVPITPAQLFPMQKSRLRT